MSKVIIGATVSLDGFIADDDDNVGPLFDWYGNGDVATTMSDPDRIFRVTAASAEYIRSSMADIGVDIVGRRLFDLTDGWNGVPPGSPQVVVVTHRPPTDWPHPDAPFTFVTDGVAAAIEHATALAGDRDVAVSAGQIGGQALAAGLVDEVQLNVVPVLFGRGKPFFGSCTGAQLMLENPRVIQGDRVLHLSYDVRR